MLLSMTATLMIWFIIYLVKKTRMFMDHPNIYLHISNLDEGIHLYRDPSNVWYFSIFMVRRIVFVALPTFFFTMPFL